MRTSSGSAATAAAVSATCAASKRLLVRGEVGAGEPVAKESVLVDEAGEEAYEERRERDGSPPPLPPPPLLGLVAPVGTRVKRERSSGSGCSGKASAHQCRNAFPVASELRMARLVVPAPWLAGPQSQQAQRSIDGGGQV